MTLSEPRRQWYSGSYPKMHPRLRKKDNIGSDAKIVEVSPEIIDFVYDDLRRLAAHYLKRERPDHTLQPTALVHEVWLRLQSGAKLNWQTPEQFFAFAAKIMRHVLVDHARMHSAGKRPTGGQRCELNENYRFSLDQYEQLLAVDDALDRLCALDARQAHIVELRFFAGLSEQEISDLLHISIRTVRREWKMAKAWLQSELP